MAQQSAIPRPRGRPRSFDENAVIERAMDVFWSRGYHGTSLPDLLGATELSRGSLYAAFGDKRALFLLALDRYIADGLTRLDLELGSRGTALAGIRACMAGYVKRTGGAHGRRGCLLVATTMELTAHDPEVAHRIRRFFKAMETRLAAAFVRAKAAGELADGVDPSSAARLLIFVAVGLRVVGKTGTERAAMQATIDTLIDRFTA